MKTCLPAHLQVVVRARLQPGEYDEEELFSMAIPLLVAILISACAQVSPQTPMPTPTPDQLPSAGREQDRISDRAIVIDRRYMSSLRERMLVINSGGVAANNYHLNKADAWLDFATEEYANNDRSGIVERVLEQSVELIRGLEAKQKNLSMNTPILIGSRKIRDDLWQRAQRFKSHDGFRCVEGSVARLEVQLVWAGHEEQDGGWRNARPYIEIAEEMAERIELGSAAATLRKPGRRIDRVATGGRRDPAGRGARE